MYIGWKCFPTRKGMVSSFTMFANGLGPICANTLTTMVVNPNNLKPWVIVEEGATTYRFYADEVSSRVPWMF